MYDHPLPRDPLTGSPVPDSEYPHTQLGLRVSRRRGKTYRQMREFGNNGKLVRDIDCTNHDRYDHANPHQHRYDPITGKRLAAEPVSL
jgi:hypothetical protein